MLSFFQNIHLGCKRESVAGEVDHAFSFTVPKRDRFISCELSQHKVVPVDGEISFSSLGLSRNLATIRRVIQRSTTVTKQEDYRSHLVTIEDWDTYLLAESHLPGPRSNLELMQAAADLATPEQIEGWLDFGPEKAPQNTPGEFLAVCGTVGLGRLLAEGNTQVLQRLRDLANDPRWRVREGVAMALQRLGDADMNRLVESVQPWVSGTLLEQRATAAGLCEPRLLTEERHARAALDVLDEITRGIAGVQNRKTAEFEALRKGLAYCWSVAVVALPAEGKERFAAWVKSPDRDIHWIVSENLKKNRLIRMDAAWVETCRAALSNQ
jgi:hypothetical protein